MSSDRKDKQVSRVLAVIFVLLTCLAVLSSEIPTLVVDSPPDGVNLTGCVVDRQTGHCCIDKVDRVSSSVTDPVLECLTHHEKICHTSYVTEFVSKDEKVREWSVVDIYCVCWVRIVRRSTRRNVGSS